MPSHMHTRFASFAALSIAFIAITQQCAQAVILNFAMNLDGLQDGVVTDATGTGTATLNTDTRLFSWNITFSGLSSAQTGAHFHGPASVCEDADIRIELPMGSPIVGSQVLDVTAAAEVVDGRWYVNIHTATNPGGEIRGQVVPTPLIDPIPSGIPDGPIHVRLETVSTGLTAPNWGASAPGDDSRLFIVDQPGTLWAIDLATGVRTTFHDVSSLLVPLGAFGPGTFDERGFLGVAFHPDYQLNGLLYTFTSEPVGPKPDFTTLPAGAIADCQTVIREWQVPNPGDPGSVVDPASSRVLMRIDKPQFNHNAGAIAFGPDDDLLYIALGDGGGADDQDGQDFIGGPIIGHGCEGNGQNLDTVLGKILRIDPLGSNSANGQYGIPADNPFVGFKGVDEIWCYGLRNPFRFSFDSETGAMYIGDVGQNAIEEVNIGERGGNFGWRAKEGSFVFVPNGAAPAYVTDRAQFTPFGLVDPVAQYDHNEGVAIIGGFVYHGRRVAPLRGRYVFGEFAVTANDGRLFMLSPSNEIQEFPLVGQSAVGLSVMGIGQDGAGEVYLLGNSTGTPFGTTGVVLRLVTKTGDINADGATDIDDLIEVILHWGACAAPPAICPPDVFPIPDGDGDVDVDDLLTIILNWG